MPRRSGRLFAGRGIALPGVGVTVITILLAFTVGMVVAWGTSLVVDRIAASPTPSATASPSPSPSPTISVSLPPLEPITRPLDDADRAAGLTTLSIPERGEGTFTPAPARPESTDGTAITVLVRIDIEDGVPMSSSALSSFVMAALNDVRGWGQDGTIRYVQTDGAPDLRIVFASPYTAAAMCADPHEPASLTPTSSASPSPSAGTKAMTTCPSDGVVVVSAYDWAAGLAAYGDDRTGSRVFLMNHGVGHTLGKPDATCTSGRADVMVDQVTLASACTPNPWPYPDAQKASS